MVVINIEESAQFHQNLNQAGGKPVFVDFFATWCGPCKAVAPLYEELSNTFSSQAIFLKLDVDEIEDISATHGITAMPTFLCFRNRQKVEELRGGDFKALEVFVKKHAEIGGDAASGDEPILPKGQINLNPLVDAGKTECLNESDDHVLAKLLDNEDFLESDVDEQLLMTIAFNQNVKIHSFKLVAEGDKAPKTIKFFVNLPNTPDFDGAENMPAVQEFTLAPEDMTAEKVINLKYVKFQNVQAVTVFIKDNQGDEETTKIDKLLFIGSTVSTTNMNEFKRVAGKKGESH